MNNLKVAGQEIQGLLNNSISQISSSFMEITACLKESKSPKEVERRVKNLFKTWMKSNRELSGKTKKLIDLSMKI
ncbi:MAG: hypothetical protein ACE5GL_10715, partial [Calditrichia bacterium]